MPSTKSSAIEFICAKSVPHLWLTLNFLLRRQRLDDLLHIRDLRDSHAEVFADLYGLAGRHHLVVDAQIERLIAGLEEFDDRPSPQPHDLADAKPPLGQFHDHRDLKLENPPQLRLRGRRRLRRFWSLKQGHGRSPEVLSDRSC